MFNLHDFVLNTILKMIGNVPDYQVMKYALAWYEKEVLTNEDMTRIQEELDKLVPVEEQEQIEEQLEDEIEE